MIPQGHGLLTRLQHEHSLPTLAVFTLVNALLTMTALAAKGLKTPSPPALDDLWKVYETQLAGVRYVDLTHDIEPNMPVWEGFNQPQFSDAVARSDVAGFVSKGSPFTYGGQGFRATAVSLPTDQLGTQLDPPSHWNELGATISDIPPTVTLRPLVVVDITAKVAADAGYHASVADVLGWEAEHGEVPEGSAVFFRSDWSRSWADYAAHGMPATFPGVELAALKFLHLNRSVLVHGHEPLDTDMTPSLEGEAWLMHQHFMQAAIAPPCVAPIS